MVQDSLRPRPSFRALGNAAKLTNFFGGGRAPPPPPPPPRPMSAAAAAAALLRFCDDRVPPAVALGLGRIVALYHR